MANKFMKAAINAEILGSLYKNLEEMKKDLFMRYEKVGLSDKQATDWRTGELLWEDDAKTIPVYADKYDYVQVDEADLSDDTKLRRIVIDEIMAKLEKLL